jgi:L-rhamnose mutarotase
MSAEIDGGPMTEQACFLLRVRPERLPEYLAAHESVWPEMLEALSRAGWRNYSLFLHEDEGLVVGYFESDDPLASMAAMGDEEIDSRWQSTMAPFFAPTTGTAAAGENVMLRQYFHLA